MMEQFKAKYKIEAQGTIADINELLPKLKLDQNDADTRYDIFRHMHSLKGGGAMFGFEELSEITAIFEKVYDKYRENFDPIPDDLFLITEKASPLFTHLLNVKEGQPTEIIELKNELQKKLQTML